MITLFKNFNQNDKLDESSNSLNESIELTDNEKNYLWSKIEYKKKRKAISDENKLFNLLKGDKNSIDDDDFNIILNSLEYTFRKKLSGMDKPMKSEIFNDIFNKIPSSWIGVKYSSLISKKKRDEKED